MAADVTYIGAADAWEKWMGQVCRVPVRFSSRLNLSYGGHSVYPLRSVRPRQLRGYCGGSLPAQMRIMLLQLIYGAPNTELDKKRRS